MSLSFRSFRKTILIILLPVLMTALAVHFADVLMGRKKYGTPLVLTPGPWGELETWDTRLEQPAEYAGFESVTADGPYWNFGPVTPEAIRSRLIASGLGEGEADHLLRDCRVSSSGGILIKPDLPTLLGIDPDERERLYKELSSIPGNRYQAIPYFIRGGNPEDLFADHPVLSKKVLPTMKKLCYRRNGFTYFSDPEAVLSMLSSEGERREFLRSLTGQSVVFVRLRIRPGSDIDKPLNYWALSMPGVMMKNLRPLLESQARLPGGGSVSILYLLPPLAREKLFTSPLPPASGLERLPDCHWTALNFFNSNPDPRMRDNDYAARQITENYYQVASPGIAGDLVLLLDDMNRVIHSSVYIAGDVVFTKNGINYAQPWILMHEKDLIGTFSSINPVKVAYFRRKGI